MAYSDDHRRLFRARATQGAIEELHRIRRVCQADQTSGMQRCQQNAGGNVHAFGYVVVLVTGAVRKLAPALGEDHDQPGRDGQMRFVFIGADRLQRLDPFIASATCIELAFFFLSLGADPGLQFRVRNGRKEPGLVVGARWRGARRPDAVLDHLSGHRLICEIAHRVAPLHMGEKLSRLFLHLRIRVRGPVGQWQRIIAERVL